MTTQNAPENSFSLTLFDIYRKKDPKGPLPEPPTFTWTDRNGASQKIPFLQPVQITKEEGGEKSVRSALHRLYPLAQDVFRDGYVFRVVPDELLNELTDTARKGIWHVGSDDLLPVCFLNAGGFCFEENLILYLEVQPLMPGIDADYLARLAIMLTNKLCYKKEHYSELTRRFKTLKEGIEARSPQKVVQDRFQGNDHSPLIKGLSGEPVTVPQIFADLAGPNWESMLLDRFLIKSLLTTPVDAPNPIFSQADEENLIRLARGMSEKYLPAPFAAMAGHVIPVQTFANILFLAANEGVAGHVKQAPGQDFLLNEHKVRYRTEYMLLFVLAVYQHYRLIDLIGKLAHCTEELHKNEHPLDSNQGKELRELRYKLALHEVKYVNTKPAFLTNYQQYYTALRQGLNTGALEDKLRRSVAELDALEDAKEQRRTEEYQRERKRQEEQEAKRIEYLAIIIEIMAMPYYLLNLLEHAHVSTGWAWALSLLATFGLAAATWRWFKRSNETA